MEGGNNTTSRPISILIAEDDPGISRMMSLILKDEGFEVTIASDGAEALKLVESDSPDVLLLDLRLPIVSGEEVASRVTKMDSATRPKIVITSASSRVSEIASNLGVDGFLVKPFEIDDLIAATRKVMGLAAT